MWTLKPSQIMAALGTEGQHCEPSSKPWINERQETTEVGIQSRDMELVGMELVKRFYTVVKK